MTPAEFRKSWRRPPTNGMRGRKMVQNDVQVLRGVFLSGDCLVMLGNPASLSYCELLVV